MANPGEFWTSIWDYFDVLGDRGDGPALTGTTMPDMHWFPDATLNYARNALRTAWTDPDRPAIIAVSERRARQQNSATPNWPPRWPGSRAGCGPSA